MTSPLTCRDPLVAELHALRERLAERFDNDLNAYSEAAAAHCRALGFQIGGSPDDRELGTRAVGPAADPRGRPGPDAQPADR